MDKILFFDGVCVLCSGLVDFALKHDKRRKFKFATLQGKTAQRLVPNFTSKELHSVVLVDETGTYSESDAIIRLLIGIGGIYHLAVLLKIFPKRFRDLVYRFIAKNRYRWFGKAKSCRLPSEDEKDRLID